MNVGTTSQSLEVLYKDMHRELPCKGKWKQIVRKNIPYSLDTLGIVFLKKAFFISCPKCGAMYFAPGFEQAVTTKLAEHLVLDRYILEKAQLRYLRTLFGLTQKDIAQALDIDVKEYNKFESTKVATRIMNPDKQVRLKLYYASKLGLSVDKLMELWNISDQESAKIPDSISISGFADLKLA